MSGAVSPLTDRQPRFIQLYATGLNASSAARDAGYSEKTAGQIGHALLKKVEIQTAIDARLTALAMDSAEATARLSAQARGELPTKVTRNGESR